MKYPYDEITISKEQKKEALQKFYDKWIWPSWDIYPLELQGRLLAECENWDLEMKK